MKIVVAAPGSGAIAVRRTRHRGMPPATKILNRAFTDWRAAIHDCLAGLHLLNSARPMKPTALEKQLDVHSEEFLHSLMRKQLKLSIACALAFLLVLFGLPLANYFFPELMATRMFGGFTLTWFLLGIGFFPAVWTISFYFIRRSIALEEEEVREVKQTESGRVGK